MEEWLAAELAKCLTPDNVLGVVAEAAVPGSPPSIDKACNRFIVRRQHEVSARMLAVIEQMEHDKASADEIDKVMATHGKVLLNAIRSAPNYAVFETTKGE
jgi:hypothetical protein